MVNPEIINERLRAMEENIILLEELKSVPFDKFRRDQKIFKLALYSLQICIQSLLDICHHIIVENNLPRPATNQEAIKTISENNIIPADFANIILPIVGLRNLLVHEYIKVDLDKIYRHLQKLDDFRIFQKHIIKFLQSA
ncbi:MAG: DUF86 domain-containing protein [Candidatus Omnitrophica bacterium]|nr:DUF86 domain-containing protein [Candidatus Omnitrophota bacterium]